METVSPQVGERTRGAGQLRDDHRIAADLRLRDVPLSVEICRPSRPLPTTSSSPSAFSILGLPFDLTVVAAVLAVIGYSLNDTVVAFDRIRENFFKLRGVSAENR